jgi:hypothetical protein
MLKKPWKIVSRRKDWPSLPMGAETWIKMNKT